MKASDSLMMNFRRMFGQIAERRAVSLNIEKVHEAPSVQCSARISEMIRERLRDQCGRALTLPSGAGHDAAAMVELTEIGMIFVRCAGSVSHSPDKSITREDAAAGANLLLATIQRFA